MKKIQDDPERRTKMEFRKVFDTIPEQFDRYRPRYSAELFADLIAYAGIGPDKRVLELGPGTGQATDPILDTGCDYHAVELGANLCAMMRNKYGHRPNFRIVNDDFITWTPVSWHSYSKVVGCLQGYQYSHDFVEVTT